MLLPVVDQVDYDTLCTFTKMQTFYEGIHPDLVLNSHECFVHEYILAFFFQYNHTSNDMWIQIMEGSRM